MDARQQTRVTAPTALQPPGQTRAATPPDNHRWVWAVLAALLLLGVAVIFALPELVAPVRESTVPAETPLPEEPPPPAGDNVALRDTAHQTLQTYLQLHARLKLENADAWGEPAWSEATARVAAGDRSFARRQFAAAARDYQAALSGLQQLEANRGVMLSTALEEGSRALAVNDVETAMARFAAALAIEPENPVATRGRAKAANRHIVIDQMNRGQAAEASSDLESAQAAYRQATQLDTDYAPARTALQQVTEQINARDFTAAMSRALAALDAGQTGVAGKALAEAGRLKPGETAVRDARQRLRGIRAQAGLSKLRRQVAGKVSSEDWQAAAELYRKALAIDPAAGFARVGLDRAEERIRLHAQIDHYLDAPARVYSAKPLANAEQLLAAASDVPPNEPRLAKKIMTLHELVTGASTPVTVTLSSDGATSVVIYRVGRLGQFDTRRLELLPGDYTVVGSRPGYRDIRKVITVRPGVPMAQLVVRCEEMI